MFAIGAFDNDQVQGIPLRKFWQICFFTALATLTAGLVTAAIPRASINSQTDSSTANLSSSAPYVILTNLASTDPYFEAVSRLQKYRKAQIVKFDPAHVASMMEKIRRISPVFVGLVLRPEELNINLCYDILEISFRLDDDPFPDFAYGFITGATASETLALVENMVRAESNPNSVPRRLVAFGPSNVSQSDDKTDFEWLPDWQCIRLAHKPGTFPRKYLDKLADRGIIRFWGHGSPRRVDGSLSYSQLRNLNLYPAVVFAGPCFSAVVHRYYEWNCCDTSVHVDCVPVEESLALMFIAQGATAYFGALHENKCGSAAWEMEDALATGDPLGIVMKHTYDTVIMAQGGKRLAFPRLRDGESPPKEDPVDFQINRTASRILLGDPAYQPFSRTALNPIKTTTRLTATGMEIEASVTEPRMRFTFVDVFHTDLCTCDTPDDVLYFRVELPDGFPKAYSVSHSEDSCPLKDVKHSALVWAEESWLGKRFLHVQVAFTHCSLNTSGLKFNFKIEAAMTNHHDTDPDYPEERLSGQIESRVSEGWEKTKKWMNEKKN